MDIFIVSLGCVVFLGVLFMNSFGKQQAFLTSLQGRHVVITGGSSGIGLSLAKRCLVEGAYVTLIARTKENLLKARRYLMDTVGCSSDCILVKAVDVACPTAIAAAIEECFKWRPIDVLICNAGIARGGYLEDLNTTELESQYRINLLGSIYPVHAALPLLKRRSQKHPTSIVFMNSLCSLYFACGANTYMVSKYAQKGLAELLKVELRPWNINVQMVIPGYTETAMLDEVDKFSSAAPLWRKLFMFKRENAQSSDQVAVITMEAVKRGNFLTTTAADGFALGILGRGLAPEDRPFQALLELLLLLPARVVSFVWIAMITILVRRQAALLKAKVG